MNRDEKSVSETIVMLREMSADEKIRQEAYYREKRLHDEATALGNAKREGIEQMIAGMRASGLTEEQIEAAIKAMP